MRLRINWPMVFDGRIWRLDFGTDYECSERKARDRARAAARRRGLKLKTACHFEKRSVYVQATPRGEGIGNGFQCSSE